MMNRLLVAALAAFWMSPALAATGPEQIKQGEYLVRAGDCVACHNPHAGKTPGFIQPDPVSACLACHSDQADSFKKVHLHQPAYGLGCATCHEPHGSDNEHLLRAKGSALCLECHGPDAKPQKLETEHVITIFNGEQWRPFAQQ